MCNQGFGLSSSSTTATTSETLMDTPANITPSSPEEQQKLKMLCSFGGSILPRPQDGKLRYVGGETRIVSLNRDISYEELLLKMKDFFELANLIKYQQPDEDLDALVSVVNDDDVTNMMEEYDKLGSGDGFTRLRIFLFNSTAITDNNHHHQFNDSLSASLAHFETTGSTVDDRGETERRYVDALNSLNDSPEHHQFRRQQSPDSPPAPPPPPLVVGNNHDQYFNQLNLDFGIHSNNNNQQRNCEVNSLQFNNLRQLTIPRQGQQQLETPWSPGYFSPRYPGSPSSSRYRMQYGEVLPEQQQMGPPQYEQHQSPFLENVVWLPPGAVPVDKGGFPGNLSSAQSVTDGGHSSICDNCRVTFQRGQNLPESARYTDSRWKQQPHLEPPPSMGNEYHQFANPCVQCTHSREGYVINSDGRLDHGVYPREHNDPQSFYNDAHSHERGWAMHHQMSNRGDESRAHVSGTGRMNEHYLVDGSGMNLPPLHGNSGDGHQMPSTCVSHEDPRYIRVGPELGNEGFHEQSLSGVRPQIHIPTPEDRGVRYGNVSAVYGADNLYQVSHAPAPVPVPAPVLASSPAPALWIKVRNPMHSVSSYEALNMLSQGNGSGYVRGVQESSPSFHNGLDSPNPWAGNQQPTFGFDGSAAPPAEFVHGYASKLNMNTIGQDNLHPFTADLVCPAPDRLELANPAEPVLQVYSPPAASEGRILSATVSTHSHCLPNVTGTSGPVSPEEKSSPEGGPGTTSFSKAENLDTQNNSSPGRSDVNKKGEAGLDSKDLLTSTLESVENMKLGETYDSNPIDPKELSIKRLSFLPELIASVKKAALEGVEEVKARVEGEVVGDLDSSAKEAASKEHESVNMHDVEVDSDSEHKNISKIEPTKAEEEALARGLQTIRNDDLEEIRELGSGTYGAVFHGKWKGSDVAVKRIKASCFAGRPSERERLIADFWKEALILSSLHHPNVVSFYGIVRDGPDGSLATVTEFMINGSLKQFIQKKDRTIDRRKRLIIAMDAAFGMEYLHAKNIVHFDLKCENLLVNMRDPHRPVCKIGDLGLSKVKQQTLVSGGVRGTLPWMAPELLSGKSNMVTEKIDVYSFGIVMWELLTGEEPYADMHCASLIGGIVHNSLRPEIPSWCDPEWKALMETCWASEPGRGHLSLRFLRG